MSSFFPSAPIVAYRRSRSSSFRTSPLTVATLGPSDAAIFSSSSLRRAETKATPPPATSRFTLPKPIPPVPPVPTATFFFHLHHVSSSSWLPAFPPFSPSPPPHAVL